MNVERAIPAACVMQSGGDVGKEDPGLRLEGVQGMRMLLNAGIVVFDDAFNALPVAIGGLLVLVGLLGLAALAVGSAADFNKGAGAVLVGPAPSPYGEQLPGWMPGEKWEDGRAWDDALADDAVVIEESMPCQMMAIPIKVEGTVEGGEDVNASEDTPIAIVQPWPLGEIRFFHGINSEKWDGNRQQFEEAIRKIGDVAKLLKPTPPKDAIVELVWHLHKGKPFPPGYVPLTEKDCADFKKIMDSIRKDDGHAGGASWDGSISQAAGCAAQEDEDHTAGDG